MTVKAVVFDLFKTLGEFSRVVYKTNFYYTNTT